MLGLLTLAISHTGSFRSCLRQSTTSGVAVAVRAIRGTWGKCDARFFSQLYAGLYRTVNTHYNKCVHVPRLL